MLFEVSGWLAAVCGLCHRAILRCGRIAVLWQLGMILLCLLVMRCLTACTGLPHVLLLLSSAGEPLQQQCLLPPHLIQPCYVWRVFWAF